MGTIKVNPDGVADISRKLGEYNSLVSDAISMLRSAARSAGVSAAVSSALLERCGNLQKRMTTQQERIQRYMTGAAEAAARFVSEDSSLFNDSKGVSYLMERTDFSKSSTTRTTLPISMATSDIYGVIRSIDTSDVDTGDLLSVLSKMGAVGSLASLSLGLSDRSMENLGKSAMSGIGLISKLSTGVLSGKGIDYFGTNAVKTSSFGGYVTNKLGDYVYGGGSSNLTGAAKAWRNVGVTAKWGGVALSAINSFTGNMEEYNYDFTNPRMYAETIGETAADVGLGIAAGAVVATLAGPLAPVWAVGVVTAGSVMLVDMISEAAFGKDAAEFVSDLAIDTVEAVGDAAAKAGELIGEAAGKAADFVADTAKNVGSAVLSVGKSIGSKLKGLFS